MLYPSCEISIGTLPAFDFVHEVKVESAWQKFTDTATITLPRKLRLLRQGQAMQLPDLVQVGDAVTIKYGYDGARRTEFAGYVAALKPGTPWVVECEDAMWALKRRALKSVSWRAATLRQVLAYVRDQNGLAFEIEELGALTVGKYAINQATGAQVLDDLKKRFGLCCFFRGGRLVAGNPYNHQTAATHRYAFAHNVVASDLAYTRAQDVALHFRASSTQPDGKKLVWDETGTTKPAAKQGTPPAATAFSAGLGKGELRELQAPPGLALPQLEAWARAEMGRLRFDGYRGGLTTFGNPAAEHGDVAEISDPDYPERAGRYYIDSVTKTFGVNGSRRQLKLGPKA